MPFNTTKFSQLPLATTPAGGYAIIVDSGNVDKRVALGGANGIPYNDSAGNLTGTTIPGGGSGSSLWRYKAKTSATSGYPGDGFILWDNATQTSATHIIIAHMTSDSVDIDLFLSEIKNGGDLIIQDQTVSTNYQKWAVTGSPTNTNAGTSTSYWTVPVTLSASSGTGTTGFPNNTALFVVDFNAAGSQSAIQFKNEGSNIGSLGAIISCNFVGAAINATVSGAALTVTVDTSAYATIASLSDGTLSLLWAANFLFADATTPTIQWKWNADNGYAVLNYHSGLGDSSPLSVSRTSVETDTDLLVLNSHATSSGASWKLNIARPSSGMTAAWTWTFPTGPGTSGQFAVTDGSGNISWHSLTVGEIPTNNVNALSISSGVVNVDCSLGDFYTLALSANVTSFTFSNLPASGKATTKMIKITQNASAAKTVTLSGFKWPGGTTGVVSTALSAVDVLAISTFDQGTSWQANLANAYA